VDWPLAATIVGIVGTVSASIITIFKLRSNDKALPPSSEPAALPAEIPNDLAARLAVLEEKVETLRREMGRSDAKLTKLSELIIEWIQSAKRSR